MKVSITLFIFTLATATVGQAQNPVSSPNNAKYTKNQMISLLHSCAPHAALNTMLAVATTESGWHPYAISVNNPLTLAKQLGLNNQALQLKRQPRSRSEASLWIRWLLDHNITVSVGLLQVNTENAARFHISPLDLLDPCTNIAVGSQLLAEAFATQQHFNPNDQAALLRALSIYNSGSVRAGFSNGYITQILKNAKQ